MKVNLKKISQEKESLKYLSQLLLDQASTRALARRLKETLRIFEEIELDLELGGECIIELDKDRLEAIEEKNKWYNIYNKSDDF